MNIWLVSKEALSIMVSLLSNNKLNMERCNCRYFQNGQNPGICEIKGSRAFRLGKFDGACDACVKGKCSEGVEIVGFSNGVPQVEEEVETAKKCESSGFSYLID